MNGIEISNHQSTFRTMTLNLNDEFNSITESLMLPSDVTERSLNNNENVVQKNPEFSETSEKNNQSNCYWNIANVS